MGLFDFLKSNKPAPQTPATPAPAAPGESAQPAAPASSGPRYKGSNYTSPPAEAPTPAPAMPAPQLPIPELPDMPHFEPVNVLEQLLFNAATMPEFRPGFYQALLNEEVFVVTIPKEGEPLGEVTPVEGMEIQLQVLNDGKIPVFTSKERIFEAGNEDDSLPYMRLRGMDFFQMTQGADCALNPFSTVGKLLPATEIAELLNSNLAQGAPANVQVMLGAPTEAHSGLVEAVRSFAQSKPQVEAAYVALVHFQDEAAQPPRLLLAFFADDNNPSFLEEMGPVVQGNIQQNEQVDVMLLDKTSDEPLNQYFLQAEPVYKRAEA